MPESTIAIAGMLACTVRFASSRPVVGGADRVAARPGRTTSSDRLGRGRNDRCVRRDREHSVVAVGGEAGDLLAGQPDGDAGDRVEPIGDLLLEDRVGEPRDVAVRGFGLARRPRADSSLRLSLRPARTCAASRAFRAASSAACAAAFRSARLPVAFALAALAPAAPRARRRRPRRLRCLRREPVGRRSRPSPRLSSAFLAAPMSFLSDWAASVATFSAICTLSCSGFALDDHPERLVRIRLRLREERVGDERRYLAARARLCRGMACAAVSGTTSARSPISRTAPPRPPLPQSALPFEFPSRFVSPEGAEPSAAPGSVVLRHFVFLPTPTSSGPQLPHVAVGHSPHCPSSRRKVGRARRRLITPKGERTMRSSLVRGIRPLPSIGASAAPSERRDPRRRAVRRRFASRRPRRRHHAAGQAPLEGRPRRDRPARRAPAARLGARLGDERQDDRDGDGCRDPAAARCGSPTTARERTSSRASPRRCSPRAAPSSACSRSTRARCPRSRGASGRGRSSLGNLFRDQLDRYGELELIAERWRDGARRATRRAARGQRRRSAARRARPRPRAGAVAHVRPGRPAPRATVAPARGRLDLLRRVRHAVRLRGCLRRPPGRLPLPDVRPRAPPARRRRARDRAARARRQRLHAGDA